MKKIGLDDIKEKYIYFIFLFIYICIFLSVAIYEYIYNYNNVEVIVGRKELIIQKGILDDKYISREDLILNFPNNIFYDKISNKLIITTWDNILKIGKENVKEHTESIWYDVDYIAKHFGFKVLYNSIKNNIYVYNNEEIDTSIIKNRTDLYDLNTENVIGILSPKTNIKLLLDDNIYNDDILYATVKVIMDDGTNCIGKVKKSSLKYVIQKIEGKEEQKTKIIIANVSDNIYKTTDLSKVTALAVDMLRISSRNSIIEEHYILDKNLEQDIYAILTNGYKATNFDPNILSNIISSNENKEIISGKLLQYLLENNLKGLVIDFKNFKISDRKLTEQYIKELSAILHKNNKSILLKMHRISEYDINKIKEYVDYIIVQAHGFRNTASKISASHSTISDVRETLEQFATEIDTSKIILELAPYSILWTEKSGTVINAEVYSMDACSEYIKTNNLKVVFDEKSGQNTINYNKGIMNYKMWIEDTTSMVSKVKIANDMNVAGIAIYRSGYENRELYKILNIMEE